MSIGPCGQACSVCGFHVKGLCEGCLPGDRCPPEKAARQQCPVLFCASSRRIAFCSRDCPQYPCHLYALHLAPCPPRRGFQPAPRPDLLLVRQMLQVEWPALRMFCLGRFRVARQQGVVAENEWGQKKGPTRRVKILLACLMHFGPRGATREKLMDILWPNEPDTQHLENRFYATLSYLRQALEPGVKPARTSRLIWYEDGWCGLNLAECWIDAEAFEAYCQQAQRWERAGRREDALACWRMAVGQYHGDYLADLAFPWLDQGEDDWYRWRRDQLRELYFAALLQLAREAESRGEHLEALDLAGHILQRDSAREEAHQVRMRALAGLHQQDALARQYQQCLQELLEWEGRQPTPETTSLYLQLSTPHI